MIGYLKGFLLEKRPDHIVLLVNNVGYEIEVPASSLCLLPPLNAEVALHILTYVREDAIRLFGFLHYFDKLVFDSLIQVSGIGPKAALALLGVVDGFELCDMIVQNQVVKLTSIPGIGTKTAERLVLELKTKLQKLSARYEDSHLEHNLEKKDPTARQNTKLIHSQTVDDLKSALSNLGYKEKQFAQVVEHFAQKIHAGEEMPFEVALKQSLKKLSEHMFKN
ncbi:MAG: Holliday junction branch migration protein RuvA [Bdellovibrionota bacterium]